MQPQLFNFNGQPTLDSREVAKMIGKSHKHLMRDIRQYINDMTLGPNLDPAQFFIESNYKDANDRFRPCYLLTKKGCEFVANKKTVRRETYSPLSMSACLTTTRIDLLHVHSTRFRRIWRKHCNWRPTKPRS